jgi:hypothetical protein
MPTYSLEKSCPSINRSVGGGSSVVLTRRVVAMKRSHVVSQNEGLLEKLSLIEGELLVWMSIDESSSALWCRSEVVV